MGRSLLNDDNMTVRAIIKFVSTVPNVALYKELLVRLATKFPTQCLMVTGRTSSYVFLTAH